MRDTYGEIRGEARRVAALTGGSEASAVMTIMTLGVMAMAREVPDALRPGLVSACKRWYSDSRSDGSLEGARVDCWNFLQAKNGNSTTIEDATDVAVRALICVLWDHEEVNDLDLTVDFFAGLVDRCEWVKEPMGLRPIA